MDPDIQTDNFTHDFGEELGVFRYETFKILCTFLVEFDDAKAKYSSKILKNAYFTLKSLFYTNFANKYLTKWLHKFFAE